MSRFALVLLCLFLSGCSSIYNWPGGNSAGPPEQMWENLSPEARDLIQRSFKGLEDLSLADVHVHFLGLGTGGTGTYVHPRRKPDSV